jgi:hypothetical protein
LGCVANLTLEEYTVKKLSLTALILSLFAFADTGFGEVVRLHSKQNGTDQTAVVSGVSAPVGASVTTPSRG